MQYFIRTLDNKLIPATDADPVTFSGFEDFMFFVHRALANSMGDLMEPAYWIVSEATTGERIGDYGYASKQTAIDYAEQRTKLRGRESVNRILVRQLKKYGLIDH